MTRGVLTRGVQTAVGLYAPGTPVLVMGVADDSSECVVDLGLHRLATLDAEAVQVDAPAIGQGWTA